MGRLLLDTHALVWAMTGTIRGRAADLIVEAGLEEGILVSPVSAWELGLLARPTSGPPRIRLEPDPERWFEAVLAKPTIKEAALTATMALAASSLPGDFHRDPADRLLVATARELDVPIVTRDRRILAYAADGEVRAIAC